jgi:hypothetical protein
VTECSAIAYTQMIDLLNKLNRVSVNDFVTRAHNDYLKRYIEKTLSVDQI